MVHAQKPVNPQQAANGSLWQSLKTKRRVNKNEANTFSHNAGQLLKSWWLSTWETHP